MVPSRFIVKVKHDNENRFTWQRSNPPCKSTLDYLFIPNLARNDVQNCYIKPAPRTDHLAVILKLKIKNLDKGKGIVKHDNEIRFT